MTRDYIGSYVVENAGFMPITPVGYAGGSRGVMECLHDDHDREKKSGCQEIAHVRLVRGTNPATRTVLQMGAVR